MPQLKESLKISRIFRIDNHLFLLAIKTSASVVGGDFKAATKKSHAPPWKSRFFINPRWKRPPEKVETYSEIGGNVTAGLVETIERDGWKRSSGIRNEYAEWKKAAVNIDYHIEVGGHYYSVPYQLVGKKVEARLTLRTVEVIYNGKRIATHARSHAKGRFTTIGEHRPKSHQKHLEWTPSRIVKWAETTGPATAELFKNILSTKPHPEQGFRSCLGILRLGKKHSPERLEAACRRAISIRSYSYRSVKSILESGLDRLPLLEEKEALPDITHNNIRGSGYYN